MMPQIARPHALVSRPTTLPWGMMLPDPVLNRLGEPCLTEWSMFTQWSLLAARVSDADTLPQASPGTMAGIAALQGALYGVLSRYEAAFPDRLSALTTRQLEQTPEYAAAFQALSDGWSRPSEMTQTEAVFVLAALGRNPILADHGPLLGLAALDENEALGSVADALAAAEATLPRVEGFDHSLREILDAPHGSQETSLEAQLRWILGQWGAWLSPTVQAAVVRAVDLLAEENRFRGAGPGPVELPDFSGFIPPADGDGGFAPGPESAAPVQAAAQAPTGRLSEDTPWMPNLVLLAKQTHVWLHQLSAEYGRPIQRLDEIPEMSLATLAARGITGLWLVGLWQRSPASRDIKRRRGNPEAEASAYALYDYTIDPRLGGEAALDVLRDRAQAQGIRLAADMVPNHFGLDSRWLAEHPDRFLQLENCPYPGYRFDGPDLSGDDRIEVYLEDGYWNETDAAVVFKHVERATGRVRYIYHGNDGTQMPWNDTAQVDYLQPAVREAIISTIVDVARRFPIIRFDAAMTLARKHIERLWHPPPGEAGAIPSRAAHGASPAEFLAQMPGEFWQDVVARIQAEAPDTLLLAEAFWMMEGYFVGVLGMHRVYNSAFMHLLRDEENEKYLGLMADTLRTNPALLRRYANFMTTPDEETAADQFGTGDKYLGIATMMATLPGTPMLGHGQWEGFTEKYGMEYARAYQNEEPNPGLMTAHDRWIAPLFKQRRLFSGTDRFTLFGVCETDGAVNHDVFAYSNGHGADRSLVIYNNAWTRASGCLGAALPVNEARDGAPTLVSRTLAEALDMAIADDTVYGLCELRSNRWFLCTGRRLLEGIPFELEGYGAHVFTEIRALDAPEGGWIPALAETGYGWVTDLEAAEETGSKEGPRNG